MRDGGIRADAIGGWPRRAASRQTAAVAKSEQRVEQSAATGPEASTAALADAHFPEHSTLAALRGGAVLTAFLLITLFGMPFQIAALYLRAPRARRSIPYFYHRLICRVLGIRVILHGRPARSGRVLFVGNHCSWLDIPVLSAVHPVSFVAKHEIADWPFFGLLAKLQRTVFIERERRGAVRSQRDAIRARLDAGDALVLFPEGTSGNGNHVLPFKTALFAVVEAAQGEIDPPAVQPVSIAYTGRCGLPMARAERPFVAWYGNMELAPHLWEMVKRGPIEVSVIFHPPLSPDQVRARKAMAAAAHRVVAHGVAQAIAGRVGNPEAAGPPVPPPAGA